MNTEDMMNEGEILRNQMAREGERLASRLTELAERITRVSKGFTSSDRPAAAIAADIVNDYTQGIGAAGPILWGMIRELNRTE